MSTVEATLTSRIPVNRGRGAVTNDVQAVRRGYPPVGAGAQRRDLDGSGRMSPHDGPRDGLTSSDAAPEALTLSLSGRSTFVAMLGRVTVEAKCRQFLVGPARSEH